MVCDWGPALGYFSIGNTNHAKVRVAHSIDGWVPYTIIICHEMYLGIGIFFAPWTFIRISVIASDLEVG